MLDTKLVFSKNMNPHIKTDELIRHLGGSKRQRLSRPLRTKLQNSIPKLRKIMKPRLFYHTKRIKLIEKEYVSLNEGPVFKSPKLARTLRDSEEVICFITTVGGEIDSEINTMMRHGRLSEAYVLDALGSVAVESVAEKFHQYVETRCREEDKAVTLRFSPGYCDWPIIEQKKLFGLFDSDMTGIQLQDSCLMIPRKSISAVFGLYPVADNSPPAPGYNPCLDCSKIDCPARRA